MVTDNKEAIHYFLYIDNDPAPTITCSLFRKTETRKTTLDTHKFIFVLKGKCEIKSNISPNMVLNEKEFAILPHGGIYEKIFYENSSVLLFRIKLIEKNQVEQIIKIISRKTKNPHLLSPVLAINDILENFLYGLKLYISGEIPNGKSLYYAKTKELYYILKNYYTLEEHINLLSRVLHVDFEFANFVLKNCKKVKNATELIRLSQYGETTFNEKFKEIFFTTPYKWLNQQKSVAIYDELIQTNVPFKVIAEKYKFNTLQQFNDYCVRNFKVPPGSIRNIKK